MKTTNIFESWGGRVETSYDEIMDQPGDFWSEFVLSRNLLVIKGLPKDLPDEKFYALGGRFGRVWTREDYRLPFINNGGDPTLRDADSATPVSYFQSHNNLFGAHYMTYHADMPHVNELSYPGRALYMTQNTQDGSGTTTWLNLEHGWAQCTDEERMRYHGLEVVHHDMYRANTRLEEFPFLKTNPKTGKISPRVNCWYSGIKKDGRQSLAWINHIKKDGVPLDYKETGDVISGLYALIESKKDTQYTHVWQEGDIVVYDNWFNVHRRDAVNDGEGTGGRRLLRRLSFNFV